MPNVFATERLLSEAAPAGDLGFILDEARCTHCNLCAIDCPSGVIVPAKDGHLPRMNMEKSAFCIACQHCMVVCPEGAIAIHGRRPEDSLSLTPANLPSLDQMLHLVRGRRSVRHYKDVDVDPALLETLLAALANVPTARNQRQLTFTVIDDQTIMQDFRQRVFAALLEKAGQGGVYSDAETFLVERARAYAEHGRDVILRSAPHLLMVSTPATALSGEQDVSLALAYFELMAQSAGLGTVWCGLLKMAFEFIPDLKALLALPADHRYYFMLFGYPDLVYPRAVQRDHAAVVRRIIPIRR